MGRNPQKLGNAISLLVNDFHGLLHKALQLFYSSGCSALSLLSLRQALTLYQGQKPWKTFCYCPFPFVSFLFQLKSMFVT